VRLAREIVRRGKRVANQKTQIVVVSGGVGGLELPWREMDRHPLHFREMV